MAPKIKLNFTQWLKSLAIKTTESHQVKTSPIDGDDFDGQDWPTWFENETFAAESIVAQHDLTAKATDEVPLSTKRFLHQLGFFDLPAELRVLVYDYAIVSDDSVKFRPRFHCCCKKCQYPRYTFYTPHPPLPNHTLADSFHNETQHTLNTVSTISKQFAHEARAAWFGAYTHHLYNDYPPTRFSKNALANGDFPKLQRFVRECGPAARFIQRLRIQIDNVRRDDIPTADQLERALEGCDGLTHPELIFEIVFAHAYGKRQFRFGTNDGRLVVREVMKSARGGNEFTRLAVY